jgi:hypothetical protein
MMELAASLALNKNAMKTLRETLPKASGIKPVYVHAKSKKADLALPLKTTDVTVSVLGPENDIDFYYLGKEAIPRCGGWASSTPASPDPSTAVPSRKPFRCRQYRSGRFPPVAFAHAVHRASPSPISTARSAIIPASSS